MPRCLDLTRAVSAFAATSSASLAVLHQEQDRQRFCSALGPPRMRASRCSMIQASPTGILRAQRWHLPCSRSQTRSLTRAGTAVSSLAPTHAGTLRGICAPLCCEVIAGPCVCVLHRQPTGQHELVQRLREHGVHVPRHVRAAVVFCDEPEHFALNQRELLHAAAFASAIASKSPGSVRTTPISEKPRCTESR